LGLDLFSNSGKGLAEKEGLQIEPRQGEADG
jgi:hypothetical protein